MKHRIDGNNRRLEALPLLVAGATPPGRWVDNPTAGGLTWQGEMSWKTQLGPAVCVWRLGSPMELYGARLADGGGPVDLWNVDSLTSTITAAGLTDGLGWRYHDGEKFIYGAVDFDTGGLAPLFTPAVPQPWLAKIPSAPPPAAAPDPAPQDPAPQDPAPQDMALEMARSPKLCAALADDDVARAMYAAMCNTSWRHRRSGARFECSWRAAGGIVASLRQKGEIYVDFYCSGNEGEVRADIAALLEELGWTEMDSHDLMQDHLSAVAALRAIAARPPGPVAAWAESVKTLADGEPKTWFDVMRMLASTGRLTDRDDWGRLSQQLDLDQPLTIDTAPALAPP